MKDNNIRRWEPIQKIDAELYLDSIEDKEDGLIISLSAGVGEPSLIIDFGYSVLSYQSTTEICVLKTLDDFPILSTRWQLFITEESDYINWLVKQSYKVVESEKKRHYIIKHGDGLIHVIASLEPSVKWKSTSNV